MIVYNATSNTSAGIIQCFSINFRAVVVIVIVIVIVIVVVVYIVVVGSWVSIGTD